MNPHIYHSFTIFNIFFKVFVQTLVTPSASSKPPPKSETHQIPDWSPQPITWCKCQPIKSGIRISTPQVCRYELYQAGASANHPPNKSALGFMQACLNMHSEAYLSHMVVRLKARELNDDEALSQDGLHMKFWGFDLRRIASSFPKALDIDTF